MGIIETSRKTQHWYGESVGILVVEANYPCVPGNVANATTFPFPVRYQVVRGCSIDRLIVERDPALVDAFVAAARDLEASGVRAIAGACGFMALFQQEVADAVRIPVALSSLLQIPFIHQITRRPVGIITAQAADLREAHFTGTGVDVRIPRVVAGMDDQPEFVSAIMKEKGTLDSAAIEAEVVGVAERMQANNPEIGAILLECSDLPPYAHAVQRKTGLAVFDFVTMIQHLHWANVRMPYRGFM